MERGNISPLSTASNIFYSAAMSQAVCALCKTNDHATVLYPANVSPEDLNPKVFSARRLPDRIHETILRCSACGLVYPERLVDTVALQSLYEQSAYTYNEEESFIRKTYGRYLRKLLPLLQAQPRPLSYLDIGCGNGFMLQEAKKIGFGEVYGVEPSDHAIQMAHPSVRDGLICGIFSTDMLHGRQFDALSCFQVLDHIPDPVGFVRDCFAVLKPGGRAIFINHNIDSWIAKLLGKRCPMIDIEHTYLHTPSTMHRIFSTAGFRDIRLFPVRNDYPLYYWLHLIPGPRKPKLTLIRTLKAIGIGFVIIPFYPGNLGLIAMKP